MDREQLKKQAEYYKEMFIAGYITKECAMNMINPYLNLINRDNKNIAKAYGRYFQEKTFEDFINRY